MESNLNGTNAFGLNILVIGNLDSLVRAVVLNGCEQVKPVTTCDRCSRIGDPAIASVASGCFVFVGPLPFRYFENSIGSEFWLSF